VIKNLAIELRVTTDYLIFGDDGRKPDEKNKGGQAEWH
jgi:hypothetical protein